MKIIITLLGIISPLTLIAQIDQFDINGYAKYLFTSGKNPETENRLNDHLIHSRINLHWFPTPSLTSIIEVRLRGYNGDSPEDVPDFKSTIKSDYD